MVEVANGLHLGVEALPVLNLRVMPVAVTMRF
jgi:hypothetical protein